MIGFNRKAASGRNVVLACLGITAGVLLAGCVGTPPSSGPSPAELVWPPPPAEPRIRYTGSVTGMKDLGIERGFLARVGALIFGTRREDEYFTRPLDVHVAADGTLCVADPGARAVFLCGGPDSTFTCIRKFNGEPLVSPVAVSAPSAGGTFFVADSALAAVFAFDRRGRLLFRAAEGLERPAGLAVARDRLFVADSKTGVIRVFDLKGKPVGRIGERGHGEGMLNFPTHMCADADGRLYVVDTMNFRVLMFDPDGRYLGSIGKQGDTSGRFSRPKGVGVDTAGHVYIADALFDNVQVFDRAGRFLLGFGGAGSGDGELWLPAGVAVSTSNTIYVADSYNRRLQVFQYVGRE